MARPAVALAKAGRRHYNIRATVRLKPDTTYGRSGICTLTGMRHVPVLILCIMAMISTRAAIDAQPCGSALKISKKQRSLKSVSAALKTHYLRPKRS
jgi:hypothetical protein